MLSTSLETADMPPGIRLAILDDHALFRAGLARLLAAEPDMQVMGVWGSPAQAWQVVREGQVDLLLLDAAYGEQGIDFIRAARAGGFAGRFLIVANEIGATAAARILKSGASGIFLKSDDPDRLIRVVHLIAAGNQWVDESVLDLIVERVIDPFSADAREAAAALPDREQEVLRGIIGGLSNRKIGEGLNLSESSIKMVVQKLFSRAGVRTRTQLVRLALEGSLGAPPLGAQVTVTAWPAHANPAAAIDSPGI